MGDLRGEGDEAGTCQAPRIRRPVMDVSYGTGGRMNRTRKLDGFAVEG